MSIVVMVAYQPKKGKEHELDLLMKNHVPTLRREGLVTDRKPIIMRSQNGTIVEVFEWKSRQAIDAAHTNPAVLNMWEAYAKVCDYVPLKKLNETSEMFAEFSAVT